MGSPEVSDYSGMGSPEVSDYSGMGSPAQDKRDAADPNKGGSWLDKMVHGLTPENMSRLELLKALGIKGETAMSTSQLADRLDAKRAAAKIS